MATSPKGFESLAAFEGRWRAARAPAAVDRALRVGRSPAGLVPLQELVSCWLVDLCIILPELV